MTLKSSWHGIQAYRRRHDLAYGGLKTYNDKVLATGPIAYWPQSETSGTVANCLVNPAQNGTYTGVTLANDTTGPFGTPAPYYDGANDYCNIYSAALDAAFNGDAGTLMIWCRVFNAGVWTDGITRCAVLLGEDVNNYARMRQRVAANNSVSNTYAAGAVVEFMQLAGHSETVWVHRALTWDKAADHTQPYYNGAVDGAGSGTLGNYAGALSNGVCLIGAQNVAALNPAYGWLGPCAVWDRALGASEILDLANP